MRVGTGSRLGPYEILSPLGAGGMGEVWRARDHKLDRDVALKVLPAAVAGDLAALTRFAREAKAVAALSHPNILAIHDFGTIDGTAFAVMELLEGETLRSRLANGALPPRKAAEVGVQLANGLAAAHDKGIVHRDVKPENVFIAHDGRVKILDFGLARSVAAASGGDGKTLTSPPEGVTGAGVVLGTAGYMSPEQVRGLPADHRSDIFALGCVLYEMLSGARPFHGETGAETMAAILKDDAPPLSVGPRRIPPALDRTLRRCLEKRPEERFQSARDLAFALETVADSTASGAAAAPKPEAGEPPSIAVLPFADMSPARDQEYFCEGIAEELIHALTKLPNLRVASRTSSFMVKGKTTDLAAIGQQLKVSAVLEGSVRKAGERLRVSVQLVKAADGFHLWSERYDRHLSDVFAIQDDITEKVIRALSLVLGEKERRDLSRSQTSDVEAYDLYLRGRKAFFRAGRGGQKEAIRHFEQAAAIDPEYALAYAGIADASGMLYMFHGSGKDELERAERASLKALDLAPQLAECHASRGFAASISRRYDEAERELRTALALNPGLWEAKYLFARMRVAQGRLADAARLFEEALEIRPEDYEVPAMLTWIYRGLGRNDEALELASRGLVNAERYIAANPDDARPVYLGSGTLVVLGRKAEGMEWAARALAMGPDDDGILYNLTCTYAQAGEPERALDCLERAVRVGFSGRDWIEHDTDLDPIRGTARFNAILESLGGPR
ncbi:MAG TPA: protein kinase [Thermoanaerobaculaceae bacterium]|nr:protein kinase [Thermoanaerobaculaceae bacterium]